MKALAAIACSALLLLAACRRDQQTVVEPPVRPVLSVVAVVRTTVDKLPYAFVLDDSMAMAPNAKLSGQAKVTVVARISKSGNALPQKGDIEGTSAPVAPGTSGLTVVMSRVID